MAGDTYDNQAEAEADRDQQRSLPVALRKARLVGRASAPCSIRAADALI